MNFKLNWFLENGNLTWKLTVLWKTEIGFFEKNMNWKNWFLKITGNLNSKMNKISTTEHLTWKPSVPRKKRNWITGKWFWIENPDFKKNWVWPRKSAQLYFAVQTWKAFWNRCRRTENSPLFENPGWNWILLKPNTWTDFVFTENNFDLTWFQNWKTGFETRTVEN